MKTILKEQLIKYLAINHDWHAKGHLTDTLKWQYLESGEIKTAMADTISRKLREAEEEKRIARKDLGKSCQYKFLPPDIRDKYICWSDRSNDKKDILFIK